MTMRDTNNQAQIRNTGAITKRNMKVHTEDAAETTAKKVEEGITTAKKQSCIAPQTTKTTAPETKRGKKRNLILQPKH